MITTELNRAEFTGNGSATEYVFATGGTDIPVKDGTHIKVYLTNTGTFTADASNETFTNVTLNGASNTAHGHLNTEVIRVSAATALPTGLLNNTDYYIRDKTSTTWKLETSVGAGVSAITTAGSGTLTWTKTLLKTITTDYTVTLSGTTATVKFTTAPPNTVKILLLREVPFTQDTDLANNSQFEAESVENQLDLIVNMSQQLKNTTARNLKLSDTLLASDATETAATLNVTSTNRENKSLKFDGSGNLTVSSIDVDKAEDYVLDSKSYATETGAVVNTYDGGVASAQSGIYSAKEYAVGTTATSAKDYATKVDGAVTGTDYSAKAWSVGGTGVTTTSARGSAKDWATKSDGAVDTSEFSAKAYASVTGSNAPTDGSAKEWATTEDAIVADSEYSAKEYAQGDVLAAGGSAKSWAQLATTPSTTATDASAKEWATGVSTHKNEGSSKDWAIYTAGDVRGASAGSMSSKEWAVGTQGRGVASEGSAKDWATYTAGTVDNAGYSAKYHATDASNSAIAAKNSANAVANTFDKFDDVYLGTMSDSSTQGTNPTTNGTWAKNSSAITVVSGTNIKVGQVVTGTGMPSPPPNVISVSGTAVVVSENMAAAGSGVALTFTGYGVYGTYNGTKDGPTTDNDNGALADGMLYFNSTDNNMMVYKTTGATWIAATSSGGVSLVMHKATASGSETSFAAGTFSPTLTYEVNNIVVFLNGVRLDATDYTATTGTSITGLSALAASDELVVLAFKTFEVADAVSAASGGTFNGNVSFGDNNITNVGSIALDSIVADGSSITISTDTALAAGVDIETSTTGKIKQKGQFMENSFHQSWVLGG